jgi:hypothetical protein
VEHGSLCSGVGSVIALHVFDLPRPSDCCIRHLHAAPLTADSQYELPMDTGLHSGEVLLGVKTPKPLPNGLEDVAHQLTVIRVAAMVPSTSEFGM